MVAVLLAMGCGNATASPSGDEPISRRAEAESAEPVEATAAVTPPRHVDAAPNAQAAPAPLEAEPTPQPIARWDTAYDRPEAVEAAITQTVRAWTGDDLPLPPRCLADLMDARIDVWADGRDMCWKGNDRGCFFRTATSRRAVIQIQQDEPLADTLPHEVLHLLESCADLWEDNHEGPGFSAESHAKWLVKRRLGAGSVADVLGLEVQQ